MLRGLFKKKRKENAGQGLYASLEDLVSMRRYTVYLSAIPRRKNFSRQAGDIKSVFKGRGIELEEVRAYNFGDDVRDIDWRVTARKEQPYTKLFAEEKDREIFVWLDLSAPMAFGTKRELKSVTASKIAALIGWLALVHKDRFGCVIYDGQNSFLFKSQSSRGPVMAVFKKISEMSEALLTLKRADGQGLHKSFKMLEQNVRQQAEVFVISDFNALDAAEFKQLAAIARKTSLHLLNVYDVLEENPPKGGEYMAEYFNKKLVFDSSSKNYRRAYHGYFEEKRNKLKEFCKKFDCQLMEFRTDTDIVDNLKIL